MLINNIVSIKYLKTTLCFLFIMVGLVFLVKPAYGSCSSRAVRCVRWIDCEEESDCRECYNIGTDTYCVISLCSSGGECRGDTYDCTPGDSPGGCGGGCFTSDTPINTPEGEKEIKNLKEGDEIKSFDSSLGEKKNSIVEKIYETTRSAYYKIKTKDGRDIKVTAEHPLYTIQKDNSNNSSNFLEYLKNKSFTRKFIDRVLGE